MRIFAFIFLFATGLLISGCAPGGGSPYFDTVTILAARSVTNGLHDFGLQSVFLRGNFGVVTIDGKATSITTNGVIAYSEYGPSAPPGPKSRSSDGWLTFFQADQSRSVTNVSLSQLRTEIEQLLADTGELHALRITGTFTELDSVERGVETARSGQLIGLYFPPYLASLSATPAGWWLVDTERKILLTIRNIGSIDGLIELDACNDVQVRLPPRL